MNVLSSGLHSLFKKNYPLQFIKLHCSSFSNLTVEKTLFHSRENFAFHLENCSDIVSLRKLHACIFTSGLQNNIFLGSKLLNCYAKFGFLTESRWVSDKIINNNLSLWNSILVGYFRAGQFSEVLRRYLDLRKRKIGVDSSAITFALKSCIESGNLEFGRVIHVDAFKFGWNVDQFVGSSLIGLYSEYGDIDDASKVLDEITERDIVAYTSMITGYANVGDHRAYEAFRIARRMQEEELCPNRVTLVSLLQAAAHLEALEEGRSLHGYAIRRDIGCSDEVFETSLMDMYIKCGATDTAASIFGKMSTKSVGSWNALIAGHLQMGQPLKALDLFFKLVQEEVKPDLITLANGILSCADLECLCIGKSIHCYMIRSGIQLDLVAATALIDMYSKCNNLIQARKVFTGMEEKDVVSLNVMMAGYLQNEFACEAIRTLYEMIGTGIKPNASTILSILSALSDMKDASHGRCVHGYVFRHGFELNIEISNQLIHMYAKCGCIDFSRQVFNRTNYRDLVSWTSMMMGYVSHGRADEAIAFFRLMQRDKVNPDSLTLVSLLKAFSQVGCLNLAKEVHCHIYRVSMETEMPVVNSLVTTYGKCGKLNLARNLFEHMTGRCLTSWNTMLAAYGMHGDYSEALKLFDQMKKENVAPNEVTFMSILSACSHSGLVEEGLHIFRSMKEEYSLVPCEEHYGCIVDLLSRAGKIEEAYDLLKCLPSRHSASALGSLLAACRVYENNEMGEVIGRRLLDLEPENPSVYGLMSNIYAEGGKWDEVARIRAMAQGRGLKRTPGYSLIDLDKQLQGSNGN
ncbi:pentatricopeptide repeat-containing protein At3g03580-like [Cornus florida]|uniref:pentatricopeptide repeat-containing protein At3g03580-like n=1 Tax=Cornus florida TaxID=4283 RepID=UPI0028A0730B|nr:pentatricopeptide repeat-containing protein At3g03580-like [Cornus florida]